MHITYCFLKGFVFKRRENQSCLDMYVLIVF